MKNKNITTEDLAIMIQKGFKETAKKEEVNQQFEGVNQQFEGVNQRFDRVEQRLEKIEKLILADHKRRIEKLEENVKDLKELLAIK